MDFYYYIVLLIVTVVFYFALHELGHFLMAKYYRRDAWFRIGKINGKFAFITSHKRAFEIRTHEDLKRAFREDIKITQAGLLSVVIPLLLIYFYPEAWQFFFITIMIFMSYTIWEIEFIINIDVEKLGKIKLLIGDD